MIVLLSGNGKYFVPPQYQEEVVKTGKALFKKLESRDDQAFSGMLRDLHAFVSSKGTPVEIIKPADVVVPPVDLEPGILRRVLGIEAPKETPDSPVP
ncbi:MAG: hypothetical protein QFX35_01065 [Candidatus Verstraetearchaeota archaeon]|nr:hypothetical protein [Candidatus Verstraetearchaeota archaeon]